MENKETNWRIRLKIFSRFSDRKGCYITAEAIRNGRIVDYVRSEINDTLADYGKEPPRNWRVF